MLQLNNFCLTSVSNIFAFELYNPTTPRVPFGANTQSLLSRLISFCIPPILDTCAMDWLRLNFVTYRFFLRAILLSPIRILFYSHYL